MEDEVFEAEIMPESGNYVLNITLAATLSVSIIFLFLGTSIGQVLEVKSVEQISQNWWEVPLQDRHTLTNLEFVEGRSVLPIKGTYEVLTYTEHFIDVELPLSEEDAGFPEDDKMHVAIWRPNVPEDVKVPVIMSIHPYYDLEEKVCPVSAKTQIQIRFLIEELGNGFTTISFLTAMLLRRLLPLELDNQPIVKMSKG